jgi:chromosome segregation ATPase
MKKKYTFLLCLLVLIACDGKEKRAQALKDLDVTQQRLLEIENEVKDLEQMLANNIAELEVARDNFSQTKEFKFLRTDAERKQQIRKATAYILKVEKNIDAIKSNIEYYRDSVYRTEFKIQKLKNFLKNG